MKTTTHPTRLLHDTDKARQLPWVPSYSVAQEGVLARWMREKEAANSDGGSLVPLLKASIALAKAQKERT